MISLVPCDQTTAKQNEALIVRLKIMCAVCVTEMGLAKAT